MTREELLCIKKMLCNKKQIDFNNEQLNKLINEVSLYKRLISDSGDKYECNRAGLIDLNDRLLIVELHNRFKNNEIYKYLSYLFMTGLFLDKCILELDYSFLSWFLAGASVTSFIMYEIVKNIDKKVLSINPNVNFDEVSLMFESKEIIFKENMDISLKMAIYRDKLNDLEKQVENLNKDNKILLQDSRNLYDNLENKKIKDEIFYNDKVLKYRKK